MKTIDQSDSYVYVDQKKKKITNVNNFNNLITLTLIWGLHMSPVKKVCHFLTS